MASINNLVHETSTSVGAGNLTLVNVNGKQSFNSAFGTGGSNLFYYFISNRSAVEWEVGTGHLLSASVLVRDTVLASSNANALVTFSAGTMDITNDVPSASQYYVGGPDVAIADGGTGQATALAAFNALSPLTTRGDVIVRDASNNVRLALGASGTVLHSDGTDAVYGLMDATNLASTVPAFGYAPPINLGLAVSAAGSALTITLTGADGNTPSATNPVIMPFRNVTETTGTLTTLTVTAATSLVVSSGSTLGVATSTAFRLWVVGFNDGGTFRLGVINCATLANSGCTIYRLTGWDTTSSTAEGGAGAADSAGVFYTGTAVSSKSFRTLGFLEWNASGLTAGTWTTTNLARIQIFGPGVALPGSMLQLVTTRVPATAFATTSNSFVYATGNTFSITPASAANIIKALCLVEVTSNTGRDLQLHISRGTAANTNIIGSQARVNPGASSLDISVVVQAYDQPNTTSSQAYALQIRSTATASVSILADYGMWELAEIMV